MKNNKKRKLKQKQRMSKKSKSTSNKKKNINLLPTRIITVGDISFNIFDEMYNLPTFGDANYQVDPNLLADCFELAIKYNKSAAEAVNMKLSIMTNLPTDKLALQLMEFSLVESLSHLLNKYVK